MSKSNLQTKWEEAGIDLGLDLIVPFDLDLGDDVTIHADLLVKNFGCPNGMIVITRYDAVKRYLTQIEELDYGFSVLEEPREPYDRELMIEMLSEWGWAGPTSEAPEWLLPTDAINSED